MRGEKKKRKERVVKRNKEERRGKDVEERGATYRKGGELVYQ